MSDEVVAIEADIRESMFGEHAVGEALLARVDGRAVGVAVFFRNFSTFLGRPGLYLEDLFVEPACRGLGIGRALLKAVAAIAVARGCRRLDWSVLDWNTPAIDFYRGVGARSFDQWRIFRLDGAALDAFATQQERQTS